MHTGMREGRRVAVLGATGRTGRLLVTKSADRGIEVNALVRVPDEFAGMSDTAGVIVGNALDSSATEQTIKDCQAVLCAIGQVPDSPADLLTKVSINIVDSMERHGVKRLVMLSNTAVTDPADNPPLPHRMLRFVLEVMNGRLVRDSVNAAEVLSGSNVDWTLVRAPILTNGLETGKSRIGPLAKGVGLRVSRADVAEFMLSCAIEGRFVRERPVIGGSR